MQHATLSSENQILNGLHSIDCSQKHFANIAATMGIPVSDSLISLCTSGKREFTKWTAEQLVGLLNELLALRSYYSHVPINWSDYERVSTLIVMRRAQQAGEDVDRAAAKAAQ